MPNLEQDLNNAKLTEEQKKRQAELKALLGGQVELTPEERSVLAEEFITKVPERQAAAKEEMSKKEQRARWGHFAEQLARSLAQLAAAQKGVAIDAGEARGLEDRLGRVGKQYREELGDIDRREEQLIDVLGREEKKNPLEIWKAKQDYTALKKGLDTTKDVDSATGRSLYTDPKKPEAGYVFADGTPFKGTPIGAEAYKSEKRMDLLQTKESGLEKRHGENLEFRRQKQQENMDAIQKVDAFHLDTGTRVIKTKRGLFMKGPGGANIPVDPSEVVLNDDLTKNETRFGIAFIDPRTGKTVRYVSKEPDPNKRITKIGDIENQDIVKEVNKVISDYEKPAEEDIQAEVQLAQLQRLVENEDLEGVRGIVDNMVMRVIGMEKGVATDQDVRRAQVLKSYLDRLEAWWEDAMKEGRITDKMRSKVVPLVQQTREMNDIARDLRAARAGVRIHNILSPNYNITPEAARDMLVEFEGIKSGRKETAPVGSEVGTEKLFKGYGKFRKIKEGPDSDKSTWEKISD